MRQPVPAPRQGADSQCRSGDADVVAFVSDAVHTGAGHSTQAGCDHALEGRASGEGHRLNGWFALLLSVYGTLVAEPDRPAGASCIVAAMDLYGDLEWRGLIYDATEGVA